MEEIILTPEFLLVFKEFLERINNEKEFINEVNKNG